MTRPPDQPRPPRELTGAVRTRAELLDSGMSDTHIDRLVRRKVLHRIRYGVYTAGELWDSCSLEDRHRLHCRAVLARAHGSTVLSHVSSVIERGIPVWGFPFDVVHTTREQAERAGRRQADWVPHRGVLDEAETEMVNGVRITTPARSAFEVMTIAGVEAGLVVVNRMLHAGALTKADFAKQVELHAHWPGSLTAHVVECLADGRLESVGEDRFAYLAFSQALPKPEPQLEIRDEDGVLVARLDFAWPELKVFAEFDGRAKYLRHRRKGESLEEFLMREKSREELVCLLTGWTCIRITWADLARPERLATRIRAVLSSRGRMAV